MESNHSENTAAPVRPGVCADAAHLTKDTFALILAGGRGLRLQHLTSWRAKPAVPFGGKFRIIDFPLSNCVNSGIRRIGVATQYKAQSLIRHIQRSWSFLDGRFHEFVELLPAQQRIHGEWYAGTADAVFQNLDILRMHEPRYVLILAGDHVYKMDYGRMLAEHVSRGAQLTVGCVEVPLTDASSFGVMTVDNEHRVTAFHEKPRSPVPLPGDPSRALASMGIYIFNAGFLYDALMRDACDPDSSHDFGRDLIPSLIHATPVFAHSFHDSCVNMANGVPYWRDVGTVDAYWEANIDLVRVTPELDLYDESWPIWTHQVQAPPAKFVFDDDDRRGMAVDSMVAGGCVVSGAAVRRSVLFSHVCVREHAVIEDSVVLPHVKVGEDVVLRRAVIDKHCRIPSGMKIGVDPEIDRRRFYVTPRGITLVTTEMLGQAGSHVPRLVHHAKAYGVSRSA